MNISSFTANVVGISEKNLLFAFVMFALGLVLTVKGGDAFVDAASDIAESTGIPKFIIGATVVSLATTLPEMLVSIIAAVKGQNGMAVGNAIGSVTANLGLIMSISLIFMPVLIKRKDLLFKGMLMIASLALLTIFIQNFALSQVQSIIMIMLFVVFVTETVVRSGKFEKKDRTSNEVNKSKKGIYLSVVRFFIGAFAIVVGADLLVDNATVIAERFGVSETVIAATVVAVGTSLPELVTTVGAIVKKESELSVGNIIGANIIDITLILPICSLITGGNLAVGKQSAYLDIIICLVISLIAVVPAIIRGKFKRIQGVLMLVIYTGYILLLSLNSFFGVLPF